MSGMHQQGGVIPDIVHIPQPYWFGEGGDMTEADFGVGRRATGAQDSRGGRKQRRSLHRRADPGCRGVIIAPDTYWPKVKQILAKYDILFVADEVIWLWPHRSGSVLTTMTLSPT